MEEDIKFMIRDLKAMGYNQHFINQLEKLIKECRDSEDILKETTKENLELKEYIRELEKNYINPSKARISYHDTKKGTEVVIEGFIPVSKAKEKIEWFKDTITHLDNDGTDLDMKMIYEYAIEILQELMEDK